jgi:hypothetical protein
VTISKERGTQAEVLVKRFFNEHGFPEAERRVLHGAKDVGDILVCQGLIAEVKGGHAAEEASDHQLRLWCEETKREGVHAQAEHAILVVKRKGHGAAKVGGWWVVTNEFGMLARFRLDEYTVFLTKLTGRFQAEESGDGV